MLIAILCFAEFGIFFIDPIAERNFNITSQEKFSTQLMIV